MNSYEIFSPIRTHRTPVKYSYVDGNPIRRRGIAVSIGASTPHNLCDDDPTESSSNQSCIISSENYSLRNSSHIRPRHRIRDRNSIYSRSSANGQRSVLNKDIGGHCEESHPNRLHPSYKIHSVPDQFVRSDVVSRQRITHTSFDGRSLPNHYIQEEFEHDFPLNNVTGKSYNHDQPESRKQDQCRRGIPRFQKHRGWQLNRTIEEEGKRIGLSGERIESEWGESRNVDHFVEAEIGSYASRSNSAVLRIESKDQSQSQQESECGFESMDSHFNSSDKENSFGDSCVKMTLNLQLPNQSFVENAQDHCSFNSISPHDIGIKKFRNRRQPKTKSDLDQSFRYRHSQSQETTVGRSTIFDDVDLFSRHPEDHGGAGYQQESSILGLRCFDHQSEIDFLGNPLFRSMPRSP